MKYVLAFILPPLAVALCGFKPLTFILSIILTALAWVPGVIMALLVVHDYEANKRNQALIKAMRERK